MKKSTVVTIVLTCTNIIFVALGVFCTILGYKLGYCKSFDERVGASECKPSRKWMY